jgi:hypothetical protein
MPGVWPTAAVLHLDMSAFETLCGPCTVYMSVYKSCRAVPGRVVLPYLDVFVYKSLCCTCIVYKCIHVLIFVAHLWRCLFSVYKAFAASVRVCLHELLCCPLTCLSI